tara:strand:+ start:123 stop:446 length:324 start_codon:yes stop_codon:yes gene_type:complete
MFYKITNTVRNSDPSQPTLTKEKQAIWEKYLSDGRAIVGEVIKTDDSTISKYVSMFISEEVANQYFEEFSEIDALGSNSTITVLDTQVEIVSDEFDMASYMASILNK